MVEPIGGPDARVEIKLFSNGSLRVGLSSKWRPAVLAHMTIQRANELNDKELKVSVAGCIDKLMRHLADKYADDWDESATVRGALDVLHELMSDPENIAAWQGARVPDNHMVKADQVPKTIHDIMKAGKK